MTFPRRVDRVGEVKVSATSGFDYLTAPEPTGAWAAAVIAHAQLRRGRQSFVMMRSAAVLGIRFALLVFVLASQPARAGEIGHFFPGLPNVRDLIVPDPGFYFIPYNAIYSADRINDSSGDKVRGVTVKNPRTGASATIPVETDVDVYAFAPTFVYISKWSPRGLKVGGFVTPTFSDASLNASLGNENVGLNAEVDSSFGVGDLFVQPLWLGYAPPHWDLSFGYGFYAPVGRYGTREITIPLIGASARVEEPDNLGLGYWTHQLQGSVAWYPWTSKGTAVTSGLTWEINQEKKDFDFTPGQRLTLNYGISQYLPLLKSSALLLELGPAGYSQWQVSEDSGSGGSDVRDQVHAIGGQIGLTYVPWSAVVNVKYLNEFAAEDRFQGHVVTITFAVKVF